MVDLHARIPLEGRGRDVIVVADAIRRRVEDRGAAPNIPPKANRKRKSCLSPFLYRNRNAIERMFCRLKDFRRVATGYDRDAANFLAAACITAVVSHWL
jgi:transposase